MDNSSNLLFCRTRFLFLEVPRAIQCGVVVVVVFFYSTSSPSSTTSVLLFLLVCSMRILKWSTYPGTESEGGCVSGGCGTGGRESISPNGFSIEVGFVWESGEGGRCSYIEGCRLREWLMSDLVVRLTTCASCQHPPPLIGSGRSSNRLARNSPSFLPNRVKCTC